MTVEIVLEMVDEEEDMIDIVTLTLIPYQTVIYTDYNYLYIYIYIYIYICMYVCMCVYNENYIVTNQ